DKGSQPSEPYPEGTLVFQDDAGWPLRSGHEGIMWYDKDGIVPPAFEKGKAYVWENRGGTGSVLTPWDEFVARTDFENGGSMGYADLELSDDAKARLHDNLYHDSKQGGHPLDFSVGFKCSDAAWWELGKVGFHTLPPHDEFDSPAGDWEWLTGTVWPGRGEGQLWKFPSDWPEWLKELIRVKYWYIFDCPLSFNFVMSWIRPLDPNEKIAPLGFGSGHTVTNGQSLPYTINFENVSTATAPAHTIRISDSLDPNFDLRTLRLGEIVFGDHTITVPENRSYFQTRVDLGAEHDNIAADVSAGLDVQSGQVSWVISAIDPNTGEQPDNPLLGLLPPNDETHRGEGHVTYTIKPKSTAATGTRITNKATIVFDNNEPIDTNEVFNTLDAGSPASHVNPLPATSEAPKFTVSWTGEDDAGGSGLATYDVYVARDGGRYETWLTGTADTQATFSGLPGRSYSFYSIARDNVGNVESDPSQPDATTTIKRQWLTPGDTNLDCRVDTLDLLFVRNRLGKAVVVGDNWQADVNKDGKINVLDLIRVRNKLGTICTE
ncbi:MAG TPA: dockerin type I repeat-containing protein, partial [Planctomycetota bacterium]|nr:dockerin type I repeat-containing protein [Planctomycetota bacterium]